MKSLLWIGMVLALGACGSEPRDAAAAPATVVDSVFSPEESLARLRAGLTPVDRLEGAESRDALVAGLLAGLQAQDTAGVVAMHATRAEFAWLYYPETGSGMDPRMMWTLLRMESEKGLDRLFARLGGRDVGYAGYRCEAAPRMEGRNRLWEQCRVTLRRPPPEFNADRLFGTIVERDGSFKFLSYKTDL